MVRITSDVNWTPGRANKVLGAGVQTSYVYSSNSWSNKKRQEAGHAMNAGSNEQHYGNHSGK